MHLQRSCIPQHFCICLTELTLRSLIATCKADTTLSIWFIKFAARFWNIDSCCVAASWRFWVIVQRTLLSEIFIVASSGSVSDLNGYLQLRIAFCFWDCLHAIFILIGFVLKSGRSVQWERNTCFPDWVFRRLASMISGYGLLACWLALQFVVRIARLGEIVVTNA